MVEHQWIGGLKEIFGQHRQPMTDGPRDFTLGVNLPGHPEGDLFRSSDERLYLALNESLPAGIGGIGRIVGSQQGQSPEAKATGTFICLPVSQTLFQDLGRLGTIVGRGGGVSSQTLQGERFGGGGSTAPTQDFQDGRGVRLGIGNSQREAPTGIRGKVDRIRARASGTKDDIIDRQNAIGRRTRIDNRNKDLSTLAGVGLLVVNPALEACRPQVEMGRGGWHASAGEISRGGKARCLQG